MRFLKRISLFPMQWYLLLFVAFSSPLLAFSAKSPSSPGMLVEGIFTKKSKLGLKLGAALDITLDQDMERTDQNFHTIDRFSTVTSEGVLSLVFYDQIEVFGEVGAMQIECVHRPAISQQNRYSSQSALSLGFGINAIACRYKEYALGVKWGYKKANPRLKWMTTNGIPVSAPTSTIDFTGWQVSSALSYTVNNLVPYAGVHYTKAKARFCAIPSQGLSARGFVLENQRLIGIHLGTSLTDKKAYACNIEVRMINETAITLSGDIKF